MNFKGFFSLKCYVSIFFVFSLNFPVWGYVFWIISFSYQKTPPPFLGGSLWPVIIPLSHSKSFDRVVYINYLSFLAFYSNLQCLQLGLYPYILLKLSLTMLSILSNLLINSPSLFYSYDLVNCSLFESIISLIFHAP